MVLGHVAQILSYGPVVVVEGSGRSLKLSPPPTAGTGP
jgi:hypothetical protein